MKRKFMCTLLCIALTTSMISSSVLAAELPNVSDESETAVVAEEIVDDTMTDVSEEMVETGTVDEAEETLETDTVDSAEEPVEETAEESDVATETAEEEEILLDDEEEGFSLEAKAVPVDEAHFPDPMFRRAVSELFDKDCDGVLSVAEIKAAQIFHTSYHSLESLKGIGYLTELRRVSVYFTLLSYANFSKNTKLEDVYLEGNMLETVDLSGNPNLTSVYVFDRQMKSILFSPEANIQKIDVSGSSMLTSLDVSGMSELVSLDCNDTDIASLDVSDNVNLVTLDCSNTGIQELDLSQNKKLEKLSFAGNDLESFDLSWCKNLKLLNCSGNPRIKWDFSDMSQLTTLHCSSNGFEKLDISNLKNLGTLTCNENNLTELDLTSNKELRTVYCERNQLTDLNVANLDKLQSLNCGGNRLENLFVFHCHVKAYFLSCMQQDNKPINVYVSEEQYESVSHFQIKEKSVQYVLAKLKKPKVSVNAIKSGIELSWNEDPLAQGYKVMRYIDGNWKVVATVKDGCEWTDETVAYGNKYTYLVRPYCKIQGVEMPAESSDKVVTKYLKNPQLTTVVNTYGGVKMSWGAVPGAVNYRIYRKVPGGSFKRVGTSTTCSFVDTKDLVSNQEYIYTVRCISADGAFTFSNYEAGMSVHYLQAPEVTKLQGTAEGIQLSWEKVTGATYYRVYYREEGGSWNKSSLITASDFLIKDVQRGKKYYVGVKAIYKDKQIASSYDTKNTYLTYDPPLPVLVSVSGVKTGVKVTWESVVDAEGYRVYRKEGSGSWTKLANVAGDVTSYVDKTAVAGVEYTYTLRLTNAKGTVLAGEYDRNGLTITY